MLSAEGQPLWTWSVCATSVPIASDEVTRSERPVSRSHGGCKVANAPCAGGRGPKTERYVLGILGENSRHCELPRPGRRYDHRLARDRGGTAVDRRRLQLVPGGQTHL